MKRWSSILGVIAVSISASGCAYTSNLLEDDPKPQTIASAAPDLTMPPDLRLPPPGSGPVAPAPAPSYDAAPEVMSAVPPAASGAAAPATAAKGARKPEDAAYEKYGIVIYNPDGTRRPDYVLREELQQAILKEKQQNNPNYGTVFNIGNIFKDE